MSTITVAHVIANASPTNSAIHEHVLAHDPAVRPVVVTYRPMTGRISLPPEVEVIESDGTALSFVRLLVRLGRRSDVDVVHLHNCDFVPLLLCAATLAPGRRLRSRSVLSVHNSWERWRPRHRAFLLLGARLLGRLVVCGRSAFDSYPRLLRRSMTFVSNGVDVDALPSRDAPSGGDRLRIVVVARLQPEKRVDRAIESFARHREPGDDLTVIGDGGLRSTLEDEVLRLGLAEEVRFTGLIERTEVHKTLADSDLLVSASEVEGLPVSVLEAMAVGLPSVLSDIPPHREIAAAADGRGVWIATRDDTLRTALAELRSLSAAEAGALTEHLRTVVRANFSVEEMRRRFLAVYRAALDGVDKSAS